MLPGTQSVPGNHVELHLLLGTPPNIQLYDGRIQLHRDHHLVLQMPHLTSAPIRCTSPVRGAHPLNPDPDTGLLSEFAHRRLGVPLSWLDATAGHDPAVNKRIHTAQ
jgi:hypothetical protein